MLGFVILSHNNPAQLKRLVETLNRVYEYPAISCHHDVSQSDIDFRAFSSNVAFVQKPVQTSWGRWSIVEASLTALNLLYRVADPEWFTLLSAADYPVKRRGVVEAMLTDQGADVLMDLRPVASEAVGRHVGHADSRLTHHENTAIAVKRYMHARIRVPNLADISSVKRNHLRPSERWFRSVRLPLTLPGGVFGNGFRCYVGSQWFTARKSVAKKLLSPAPRHLQLQRHLASRWVPDESYFHTVIGNDDELLVDRYPYRFSKWEINGAHPLLLGETDLSSMIESPDHFARKFAGDAPVLALVDEYLFR